MAGRIEIRGAGEHNLRGVDVDIPLGALTVVTGVSGSGKSSLAIDTLCRESQRRFLSSLSFGARALAGRLDPPEVEEVSALPAALAVDQRTTVRSPRSTVGTLSEVHDHLRLLFARLGEPRPPSGGAGRSGAPLFSFNSPHGACPACSGLGVEDRVDPALLVADPSRSLRAGALVPTTPRPYIVYSQVTMDVLDRVCREHGFTVDEPWASLTEEQRRVVLYGSDRIVVPFGKHPLESRLRWRGITARPRKEGHYLGVVTVIEGILKAKRNPGVMRFVRSMPCRACGGARLRPEALAVTFRGRTIADLAALSVSSLRAFLAEAHLGPAEAAAGGPLLAALDRRLEALEGLGLGALAIDRPSSTLSGGEASRVRLATQVCGALTDLLYVLDEPTAGLHEAEVGRLVEALRALVDRGSTVVVVEHHPGIARAADWLVDVGPGAGAAGGHLVAAGPPAELLADGPEAFRRGPTGRALASGAPTEPRRRREGRGVLRVEGAAERNLGDLDVDVPLGTLTVVTGPSGAGKTTLVMEVLGKAVARALHGAAARPGRHRRIVGLEALDKVVEVSQAPIGRTPRSNAATYTKLFDGVRALFAAEPEARARGFGPSRFSFNTEGGRCEACGGAGVVELGLLLLGAAHVRCGVCGGRRFDEETLAVRYRGASVHDVLELTVDEASALFAGEPGLARVLAALRDVGLGYLGLGQPATTLSGGEAQRVKLAAELARPSTGSTLYLLDEPTVGLHPADVAALLAVLDRLVEAGNTAVVVEHDLEVILAADRVLDLGPGGGTEGGRLVAEGTPERIAATPGSLTGAALACHLAGRGVELPARPSGRTRREAIELRGVETHNLKGIDLSLPKGRLTVVTGRSGSGKSSLAFDTLHAEAHGRFVESLSTHARRLVRRVPRPALAGAEGLTPSVAVGQRPPGRTPRSTVGTMTGVLDVLRVLFSRAGRAGCPRCGEPVEGSACPTCGGAPAERVTARQLSWNRAEGACPRCDGLGLLSVCDEEALVTAPARSLLDGAMDGHRPGRFYGERGGRYLAILEAVGRGRRVDFTVPFGELSSEARRLAMRGTGDEVHEVLWRYQRGKRRGEHRLETRWAGFAALVEEEHGRKRGEARGEELEALMREVPCPACGGSRLGPLGRSVRLEGLGLAELSAMTAEAARVRLAELLPRFEGRLPAPSIRAARSILDRLGALEALGVGYLGLDRAAATLSSGEARRVQLASALGGGLLGLTQVLDEPTVGLHPADRERLVDVLLRLRDGGSTLVVVEHDAEVVRAADHVVDLGPGAGVLGGEVVASGPPEAVARTAASTVAVALAPPARPPRDVRPSLEGALRLRGASARNLRSVDATFPAGALTAVTGVSGSGKTTLVFEVLARSAATGRPQGCEALEGGGAIASVVTVGDGPASASPLTTPASASGALDALRRLYAATDEARRLGLSSAAFGYGSAAGRCPACKGAGAIKASMDFLADLWLPCEVCLGRRYGEAPLAARARGLTIAEALDLTALEALDRFGDVAAVRRPLELLAEVGLGAIRLGQAATTLSGGEAGRLRLAEGLGPRRAAGAPGSRLVLLDEPTAGLHRLDVAPLVALLRRLAAAGDAVVVVEHDIDLVAEADWVLDLGPGAADRGGRLVATGTPAEVAACPASATGRALRAEGRRSRAS